MRTHQVVVVGAGFAGLQLVKKLKGAGVEITLIDRRNHHLFQPLLYQAATSILSPTEIAWPIRQILRGRDDVRVVLGEVSGVDRAERCVSLAGGIKVSYDTLVLATGVEHSYFGHDEWSDFAPGLKTVTDAVKIRDRILTSLERAEVCQDAAERRALMTFVVVGGGPTGVELAGMIADLAHAVFPPEFKNIDTRTVSILLVEAGPRLLAAFDDSLSKAAFRALREKHVEVRLNEPVTGCDADTVTVDGETIGARTVIWAAGVTASPAARWLGLEGDRVGRAPVSPDLSIEGDQSIFVIGDTARVVDAAGTQVPGLAPAAKQQGEYVAKLIRARVVNGAVPRPFRYKHQGSLATIGHRAAVADFGRVKLTGRIAWWVWGVVHIFFLIGARSRAAVALNWLWIYCKGRPSARIVDEAYGRTEIARAGQGEATTGHR